MMTQNYKPHIYMFSLITTRKLRAQVFIRFSFRDVLKNSSVNAHIEGVDILTDIFSLYLLILF